MTSLSKYLETNEELDNYYKDIQNSDVEKYIDKVPYDILYRDLSMYNDDKTFYDEKYDNLMDSLKEFGLNRLSKNFNSDSNKITALGSASEYRRYELMEMLLKEGTDPNIRCSSGYTCLENVIAGHSYRWMKMSHIDSALKCIRLLLDYGVDTNIDNIYNDHFNDSPNFVLECQEMINSYKKRFKRSK
jgi:ankyrin repeat protein